jgi:dTDP-4-dehydrorhamnose 3,5-epimerase
VQFIRTSLQNAWLIQLEPHGDHRGLFSRLFCAREFGQAGLMARFSQINTSFNTRKGTLRGLHYQISPHSEVKVVRCLRGALYDVITDLRPDSTTFGQWYGVLLAAEHQTMLYIPQGFAHGFITLEDGTEALYLIGGYYAPQAERGICWNDPWFAIDWPEVPVEISVKDRTWPRFDLESSGIETFRGLLGID